MKLLAFGEIVWDVYPDEKCIGGAPLNFGAHAVRQGADVYLASAVGKDSLGEEALEYAKSFGIRTEYITTDATRQTGACVVTLDANKVPTYTLLEDVAYDHIQLPAGATFDVLYFGTLALRTEHNIQALKQYIDSGACRKIFVDVNVRKPFCSAQSVMLALTHADYLKVSDEELDYIARIGLGESVTDIYACVRKLGAVYKNLQLILLTMGDKGSYVYDCRQDVAYIHRALPTQVVSTVGAGDSFSASFLVQLMQGKTIDACLEMATKVSSFVVSRREAVPAYTISDFM